MSLAAKSLAESSSRAYLPEYKASIVTITASRMTVTSSTEPVTISTTTAYRMNVKPPATSTAMVWSA